MNTIFPATVDHGKKTSKIDPSDAGDMWAVELQSFNEQLFIQKKRNDSIDFWEYAVTQYDRADDGRSMFNLDALVKLGRSGSHRQSLIIMMS